MKVKKNSVHIPVAAYQNDQSEYKNPNKNTTLHSAISKYHISPQNVNEQTLLQRTMRRTSITLTKRGVCGTDG